MTVGFAINAQEGTGGQGGLLRQMSFVLGDRSDAVIFSRGAHAPKARCIDLPFRGYRRGLFNLTLAIPLVRSRHDWLMELSDVQFDSAVKEQAGDLALFDGIMTQCATTFAALKPSGTRLVLTAINNHLESTQQMLLEEDRTLGPGGSTVLNPRILDRARREIALADVIRVPSSYTRDTFLAQGIPSAKLRITPWSVDRTQFYPVEKKDSVFRVLAVASIDRRKGIYYLLKAFEEAALPNSELLLVGGTGDRWSRRMLAGFVARNRNIRFEGGVPASRLPEMYGQSSVLVHPSLDDSFALVIIEALASGRPVIATRQSGASECIVDGRNGFIVERRDVAALVDRLRMLASDRNFLEAMSAAAPTSVEPLSYEAFKRATQNVYEDMLK